MLHTVLRFSDARLLPPFLLQIVRGSAVMRPILESCELPQCEQNASPPRIGLLQDLQGKERYSEHKVKDESNQIGYEESGNYPDPRRHLTPFCVAVDISEGKEKSRGEDATR